MPEHGDLVLILGKGHEQGQDIGGVVEPFDDRTRGPGAARRRRVIPLAAGDAARARACSAAIRRPASRAWSATRAPPARERSSARSRASAADGHDFLDDVRAAGAVAVLCRTGRSRPLDGVCVLEADEPLTALGAIARQVRRAWGGKVIGIAGSNGKTSTKDMLAALCAPHVPTLATHRNHNNRLGLPLTLFRLERGHALCICELGTSEIGELADLAAIAEPEHRPGDEHRARAPGVPGRSRGRRARGGLAAGRAARRRRGRACPPTSRCSRRTGAATCARRRSASRAATCAAWPGSREPAGRARVLDVLGERVELIVPLRAAAPRREPGRGRRRLRARGAARRPAWPRARRRSSSRRCAARSSSGTAAACS